MKCTSNGSTQTIFEFDPAALSDAAYRVLLHHGLGDKWLHIQLALWHAMTEHIQRVEQLTMDPVPKACTHEDLHHSLL